MKNTETNEHIINIASGLELESKQYGSQSVVLKLVYIFSIACLIALIWLCVELAWTVRVTRAKADDIVERVANSQSARNIEDFTANLQASGGRAEATLEHLHNSSLALFTQEFVGDMHKYANRQAASILNKSRNTNHLVNNANKLVKDLAPRIDQNLERSEKVLAVFEKVGQEMERQIQQNGNSAKGVLDEAKDTIKELKTFTVDTKEEVIALLQETTQTMKGVTLLTNDPALVEGLKNANVNLANIAIITDAFGKLSKDLAYGSEPKNKFDKYFLRPLGYTIKFAMGAGNIFVFASKF